MKQLKSKITSSNYFLDTLNQRKMGWAVFIEGAHGYDNGKIPIEISHRQ